MQITWRSPNPAAIQSDLLGAHLLGIRNILCLTGDYPTVGDHKDAKPVYDLDSVQIMQLVQRLNNGRDLAGNKLDGWTDFLIASAVTPEADPLGPMLVKFEAKVNAGAQFFQTQAIYHPERFGAFMQAVRKFKVKVLAGILLLRSAKMAEFMNANIPGISVPDEMIAELRAAGDKDTLSVTMEDMLYHTKLVAGAAKRALVIADMPFLSYQVSIEEAVRNAGRFLQVGAAAVKLEGGAAVVDRVDVMTRFGIPVMGHLGMTPQSVHRYGGYKVQGKERDKAGMLIADAKSLEAAGSFAIGLEAIPAKLAKEITWSLTV